MAVLRLATSVVTSELVGRCANQRYQTSFWIALQGARRES
jgi:hypothetical protein